jgi:hypothetical protein
MVVFLFFFQFKIKSRLYFSLWIGHNLIPAAGSDFRSGFRKIQGIFSEYFTICSTVNSLALRFQKINKNVFTFYNPKSQYFLEIFYITSLLLTKCVWNFKYLKRIWTKTLHISHILRLRLIIIGLYKRNHDSIHTASEFVHSS